MPAGGGLADVALGARAGLPRRPGTDRASPGPRLRFCAQALSRPSLPPSAECGRFSESLCDTCAARCSSIARVPVARIAPHRAAREHGVDVALLDVFRHEPRLDLDRHLARIADQLADALVRVVAGDDRQLQRAEVGRLVGERGQPTLDIGCPDPAAVLRVNGSARSGRARRTNSIRSSLTTSAADGIPCAAGMRWSATAANSARALVARRVTHCTAGTCWLKRVSTMWSAARSAIATIVEVGLTPDDVTKHEPSTTYRFGTSCARFQRSSTDVFGIVAHARRAQQVPARVAHQPIDLDLVRAGGVHRLLGALDVEVEHAPRVVGHRVVDFRRGDADRRR